MAVEDGVGVLEGIFIVDSVDAGGFGDHLGFDFEGAQRGGGIGGKEGIGGAGGEDDDAAFFEMAHGAAADIGLTDLRHLDGRHDAGLDALFFERVLQGQGVDDGGEHAHMVR